MVETELENPCFVVIEQSKTEFKYRILGVFTEKEKAESWAWKHVKPDDQQSVIRMDTSVLNPEQEPS